MLHPAPPRLAPDILPFYILPFVAAVVPFLFFSIHILLEDLMKGLSVVAGALALAFALSSAGLAQEAMKKDAEKGKKPAAVKLNTVSCSPECGFSVRSHDEKELVEIVQKHAKSAHNKDVTEKDVKGMMKPEGK